jgi:HEAT repeat protein
MKRAAAALAALVLGASLAGAAQSSFEDQLANLKSPNAGTRESAAEALGKSRRREAVAPLSELARDPEAKVRLAVVKALRELRDLEAVPALTTSLQDGDPKVREEAISSLVEIYSDRERSGTVDRFLGLFSDEFDRSSIPPWVEVDAGAIEGLAGRLADEDGTLRREAALALGILDGRAALPQLTNALQDPEPAVRAAAATAIGKIGTAADGRTLVPLIADTSNEVRNRALQALGVLRVTEAGPALRELYDTSRNRDLSMRVLETLSKVADPGQADLLRLLVQDPDPEKKRLAVEGLARIADEGMLTAFKKDFQRQSNEELRLAYAFALTRLGDRAFVDTIVLCLPSRTLGRRCRGYLRELGTEILPELYPYLNDPDASIRGTLCDLLAEFGEPEAIERLMPLINDPSREVADRANRAVERLKRLQQLKR